jgi:hypothetical protein
VLTSISTPSGEESRAFSVSDNDGELLRHVGDRGPRVDFGSSAIETEESIKGHSLPESALPLTPNRLPRLAAGVKLTPSSSSVGVRAWIPRTADTSAAGAWTALNIPSQVYTILGILKRSLPSRSLPSRTASQPSGGRSSVNFVCRSRLVSKHLRVLHEAGFVASVVEAQRRLYRLKPEPFQQFDDWLAHFGRFWSTHVEALERYLDRMDPSTPTKSKTTKITRRPKPRA